MNSIEKHFTSNRSYMLAGVIILLVNLIYASYFIRDAYPSHNMISNLIMAAAPFYDLGFPYKDYWDIYPPGIFIFLSPFEYLFNGQTVAFKFFHILFAVLIGLGVFKFLMQIFHKNRVPVVLFFALYLLLSNYYYCILFHNAFLALLVSVSGVYFLSSSKRFFTKYFLSSLLFAFSASMKETFLFTIFLPFLYGGSRYLLRNNKSFKLFAKSFGLSAFGTLVVILGNYLYLHLLGVTKHYSEVTAYKSQMVGDGSALQLLNNLNPFNFSHFYLRFKDLSDAFFTHPYGSLYYVFLFSFLFFLIPLQFKNETGKRRISWGKWDRDRMLGILWPGFFILHFQGFQLLNKTQPNYSLQMVPAFVLATAFIYLLSENKLRGIVVAGSGGMKHAELVKKGSFAFLILCFAWTLYPRFTNFSFLQAVSVSGYVEGFTLKKPEVILPEKVKQLMGNDPRIFHIYGWGTPYFYYFSRTKPFSRFFIVHPSILGKAQYKELVEQFKTELPKVIVYTKHGADMDVPEFENNTIRFEELLNKCYELYPAAIYPGYNCNGYYLLKNDSCFRAHPEGFISPNYL